MLDLAEGEVRVGRRPMDSHGRRARLSFRAVLAALCACWLAPAAAAQELRTLADGTYRTVDPPGWDGKSPMPLVLYLHGYGQSSSDIVGDADLVAAVTSLGALLVVPDGLDHAWSHVGAPRHERDDLQFLHAVVSDAEEHRPIDRARVYATGFSIGGSMVWDLACHAAQGFAAFLPVSGAFWLPYPTRCESGPVTLRHAHGLNDPTVPFGGRTIFGQFTQGDVGKGWDILLATDRCAAAPIIKTQDGNLDCQTWTSCAGGHRLSLCLHGDGHDMAPAYLHGGLLWAMHPAP
ncbi:MAG TPA: PHB depolymerase family esterase [Stellaceae bacterium]|nr:PHB depolymerase family esterase [Stellaceae bacterium]